MASNIMTSAVSSQSAPAKPSRTSRKKTAVGKTSKRSTIAMVEKNRVESRLLSMPVESRDRILQLLLGDRCIHITKRSHDKTLARPDCWGVEGHARKSEPGQLLNIVCEHRPLSPFLNESDTKFHICHATCLHTTEGPRAYFDEAYLISEEFPGLRETQAPKNHFTPESLAAFSTCRQLYEEGTNIFWSTNTFVFTDAYTLPSFLSSLNTVQRTKLANVHLHVSTYTADAKLSSAPLKGIDLQTVYQLRIIKKLAVDFHFCQLSAGCDLKWYRRALARFLNLQELEPRQFDMALTNVGSDGLDLYEIGLEDRAMLIQEFSFPMNNPDHAAQMAEKRRGARGHKLTAGKSDEKDVAADHVRMVDLTGQDGASDWGEFIVVD